MKIPTTLLKRVLLDVGLQLSDTIDKDYREICSRYEDEGMSFLTITLPRLDDALLQGLARGRLTRDMFVGFKPMSRSRSLPALLSGFFRRIFHDDGLIMERPDVCAIFAIRQVTRLFKKVELPCSKPRVKAAYERYKLNDQEVDWRSHGDHLDTRLWRSICGLLWSDLEVLSGELHCFPGLFGSGATAERLKRNERFTVRQWPERAEASFPLSFYASHQECSSALGHVDLIPVEKEQPVRVVQVPKTLKTPRTISVEPSYMMLMQQSIAKPLMMYLESKRFGFQSIRFVDQSINRRLAREGSLDGSLATIDLKDASDMVDLDLVKEIFRGPCPTFLDMILDCRSTKALLPDKTILPLRKFASMGSAMCFPVEAMVFFTIIMYALVKQAGRVPSRRLLQALAKDVAIYGDDIIVKSTMAPVVMETLESFGLRVNHDKSFHTGLFRESCGGDYYNGVDVTPAYVRHWDETGTLSKTSHKVACVSLSNTFYMKGLWHASQYLRDNFVQLAFDLPYARNPVGVLHFVSFRSDTNVTYDSRRHGYRVKGHRIRVSREVDSPGHISGFLGLAFQSRFFRDRMVEFERTALCQPHSHWITQDDWVRDDFDNVEVRSGLNSNECRCDEDGSQAQDQRGTTSSPDQTGGRSSSFNRPDGRCACSRERVAEPRRGSTFDPTASTSFVPHEDKNLHEPTFHRFRVGPQSTEVLTWHRLAELGETGSLTHLNTALGTSLHTSDRRHALSLKRGWTASQAGLRW